MNSNNFNGKPSFVALFPLLLFFLLYALTWLLSGDLSQLPISVAFLSASVVAIVFSGKTSKESLSQRVDYFCSGVANSTISLMVVIFILAGAFAGTAKAMGAVDATVNMVLSILPGNMIMVSIFIAACFISMSMGTSCGTIAALAPIAIGVSSQTGIDLPFMVGLVVGGSMFGDSLSFISDTTIVATRTQECNMSDKFKVNSRMLFPATMLLIVFYLYMGMGVNVPPVVREVEWLKVLPYLLVLIMALAGVNVVLVLIVGTFVTGLVGVLTSSFTVWGWASAMNKGIVGDMGELIIVSLLAGGMFEVIRRKGGIEWITNKLTQGTGSKRKGEASVAVLVGLTNLCTANNTIALIIAGPIAKRVGKGYGIDNRHMASLIDVCSCFVQSLLPYGAQLLIAAGLASINPMEIIPYLYYPFLMGATIVVAIVFQLPRKYS